MNISHLEMIQSAIQRLASNAFTYRGWAVTVGAGIVAFMVTKKAGTPAAGIYPIGAFWILDSYALSLERAFRRLYDAARLGNVEEYSMDIKPFRRPIPDLISAMFSLHSLMFYGTAIVCILVVDRIYQ